MAGRVAVDPPGHRLAVVARPGRDVLAGRRGAGLDRPEAREHPGIGAVEHHFSDPADGRLAHVARRISSASPAARMRLSGAGSRPVISSTWRAAWCRSRSKPLTTMAPDLAAAWARGVGQGAYTTSSTAAGPGREPQARSA